MNIQRFLSRAGRAVRITDYISAGIIAELREEYGDVIVIDETNLPRALERIYSKTDSDFIFILDEWDCIFREKQDGSDAQERYLDFLRDLFKDQDYVSLVYMTGTISDSDELLACGCKL